MKKSYLLLACLSVLNFGLLQAQTSWNFDASSTAPSSGTGTLDLIGGTAPASPAFPGGNPGTGKSYSISTFPGDTAASGTAGYQFTFSTVGYNGITITFDVAGSNPSSKWQRYEYTTDGTSWTVFGNNSGGLTAGFASKSVGPLPMACDNNPNFGFRIVSIFGQPANTAYEQVAGAGYNGGNGKWQIDNVGFTYATLSKDNFRAISGLKIYPNPAKNLLNITSDSFEAKTVAIYNVLGKVVLSANVTNAPINIANLAKGVYVVKVTEEGKTVTRKLVIE